MLSTALYRYPGWNTQAGLSSGYGEIKMYEYSIQETGMLFYDSLQLCTLILINIGAMFDLVDDDWFGTYDPKVTIHVIDSSRPMSLRNIFARGQNAERVLIWNDEDMAQFTDIEEAWKMLEVSEPICT